MNEHRQYRENAPLGVRRDLLPSELPWPETMMPVSRARASASCDGMHGANVRRERLIFRGVGQETTQAARGHAAPALAAAEIEAMVQSGIIDEDERFELIGGEVVPMSPRAHAMRLVKVELNRHLHDPALGVFRSSRKPRCGWTRRLSWSRISASWPRAVAPGDMRGHDVLLAIEIADTSLSYDLGRKIGTYAAYGIPEVWVDQCAYAGHTRAQAARPGGLSERGRVRARRCDDLGARSVSFHVSVRAGFAARLIDTSPRDRPASLPPATPCRRACAGGYFVVGCM